MDKKSLQKMIDENGIKYIDFRFTDPLGTWHYLIVSLQESEPVIRSFRIKNEEITEEEISFTSS